MNPEHDPIPDVGDDAYDCFDTNDRLVDELERILQGDFADNHEDQADPEHSRDVDFPLAEPESEPDIGSDGADRFDTAEGEWADDDEWNDPEPVADEVFHEPPRSRFWEAAEPEPDRLRPGIGARRERDPVGRFTIATILLMVVAGGTYAYVQLTADPVLPLDGQPETAAASPMGAAAAVPSGFTLDALAANPDSPAGTTAAEPEAFTPDPVALNPDATAPDDTIQPRLIQTVPITPEPTPVETVPIGDEGNAATEDPAGAEPTTTDDGIGGPLVETETPPVTPPAPETAAETASPAETATPPAAAEPRPGTTLTTATDWVNLRDGPDNDTNVILTVPAGATLEVVACDPWCEVYYEGTHGWVWQDFINPVP